MYKEQKPGWDDGEIDPGIRDVVEALNKLPGIRTLESCEGHGSPEQFHSFVVFAHRKSTFPKVMTRILTGVEDSLKEGAPCLGCIGFRLRGDYHFDCGHDLKIGWWLEIAPRSDYHLKDLRKDSGLVWQAVVNEIWKLREL